MNKCILLCAFGMLLLFANGCVTAAHVWTDERIPARDKIDKYHEILDSQPNARPTPARPEVSNGELICAGDPNYNMIASLAKTTVDQSKTCFLQVMVICMNSTVKYKSGFLSWSVGSHSSTVQTNPSGMALISIAKESLREKIVLQIDEYKMESKLKKRLDFKIPEETCRRHL